MLTKEEYIDIIDFLDFFYGDNLIATAELRKEKSKELQKEDVVNFKSKLDKLQQLIEEHFSSETREETRDNPPLKFEELEDGEWYWNESYGWCLMNFYVDLYGETKYKANTVCDGEIDMLEEFEEYRFYRKQVTE